MMRNASGKDEGMKIQQDLFNIFGEEHDRFGFPDGISRVTAGHGGEAILICGSEKTALLDCGMAYCADTLVENIRKELEGRSLDYILLSHSHYDHIGALPYVKRAYPEAIALGASHAREILVRPGARKLMKELGETAREQYAPGSSFEILTEKLAVDEVIGDGDRIVLGAWELLVLETKGHTDCSLSFLLEPDRILFASESTGILERLDYVHTPILKSYEDAMESFKRCKSCGANYIVLPHFGMIPQEFNETYWALYEAELNEKMEYLGQLMSEGMTEEEIFERYAKKYWDPIKAQEQPYEAFMINSRHIVKVLLNTLRKQK